VTSGRWALLLWYAVVAVWWFQATQAVFSQTLGQQMSESAVTGATLFALAGRLGSEAVEATWYVLGGRAFGTRVRLLPMLGAIASLSLCDATAETLLHRFEGEASPAWLALLVGGRADPEWFAEESGVRYAFGSLGLLALIRIAGTIDAQRRQGIPPGRALALCGLAVAASRLATWWTADLVRGMSPLP